MDKDDLVEISRCVLEKRPYKQGCFLFEKTQGIMLLKLISGI